MKNLDPAGHAARGPAHIKAKRQQTQLAIQDNNGSIASGSTPRFQPHPTTTPLSPIIVHSSPMDVDEDEEDSNNSIDLHFDTPHTDNIPDQPNEVVLSSHNAEPGHEPDLLRLPLDNTRPTGPFQSPSMIVALGILRNIAPQMGALTRMLDNLDVDEEVLDAQTLSLVTGGMEAAAFLERQLARVASKAQRYGS